ncbi:hypothetical protein [Xanthomonas translucens]|uniref:hypothetical protein n=1 Tax=Xanthomonas campestris pv. translucens TaxID=343 RepID=UPI00034D2945|nr:hypothetical protein [Xanthomonas translucens]WNJ30456.1 hypothetical protein RMA82_17165 [Xanthomonas translucens pv. undulosa]
MLAPLLHALFVQTAFLCATSAMLLQSAWLRRQAPWQGHAGTVLAQTLAIVLILAWLLLVAYRLWRPAGLAQSRDNARVSLLQDTAS